MLLWATHILRTALCQQLQKPNFCAEQGGIYKVQEGRRKAHMALQRRPKRCPKQHTQVSTSLAQKAQISQIQHNT
eukprot:3327682-Rhodomonas_salina.1